MYSCTSFDQRRFMRQRHSHGRFNWWMTDGFGPRGMSAGRKLESAELHLVFLVLLEEQPRHGYDLMKELTDRTGGFYAPSPGMVYPALSYLDEIGYATVESEGTKKLYRITDAGKAELEKNRETARTIFHQFERIARKMERMRRFFAGEAVDEDVDNRPEFRAARHALREALRAARDASPEAQERVLEIVRRMTDEIRAAVHR